MSRPSDPSPAELAPGSEDPVDILDTPAAGGRIIRGSVFRVAGYVAGVGLSVVSAALLIRHLGPVDWGGYVTVSSLIALVAGLSEAGMSNVGVREYSTLGPSERIRLLRNLLGIRLVLTAIAVGAAVLFCVAAGYRSVLVVGTLLSGIGLMVGFFQQTVGVPLQARLQFGWVSALDLLRQAATTVAVVVLVALGATLLPFLGAPIAVSIFMVAVTLPLVRRLAPVVPAFDRGEWSRILQTSVAYSAASAIGTIYVAMTVVLMSLVGSGRDTGYYGASYRIFSVLGTIPLLLVTSAFPVLARAARDDRERLEYALQKLLEIALIVGVLFALGISLAAPFLIDVVAGAKFDPSVDVLRIHGLALISSFLAVTLGFALLSERRHTAILIANAAALLMSAALTLGLVPLLGARGAAIATVAGESTLVVAYGVTLFAGSDLKVELGFVLKVAVAAGAALLLLLVPGLGSLPLALAATIVYAVVLLLVRGIPRELGEQLLGMAPLPDDDSDGAVR